MRKLLYISLIALAGCTSELTGPTPPVLGSSTGISSYFWPDSNVAYSYRSSTGNIQTVYISNGGAVLDKDQNPAIPPTSLTINWSTGSDALSGISHSDIFGFDTSIQVVADTMVTGATWTEAIRSIATASFGFGHSAKVYAASDSVLYSVDPNTLQLDRIIGFPKSFTLAEDVQDEFLFAYQMNGDSIIWTSDDDCRIWTYALAPSAITAFASASQNFFFDIGWFACGTDIYRITIGSNAPQKVASLPSKVVALAGENNGVVAGLDNGAVYDVSRNGQMQPRQSVPTPLVGIALVSSGSANPVIAGTSSGVFSVPAVGYATLIDNGSVSAIFATANSIFAEVGTDSVFHYNPDGSRYGSYANPNSSIITQFAHPTSTFPNPSLGIYVLAGTSIFRRDSVINGSWTAINQMISAPPSFSPGSLTLLSSDTTWTAGKIERNAGSPQQRGYSYVATRSGPFPKLVVNGTTYNNVMIVSYTSSRANFGIDTTNIPQFNIYYEQGVGPVVIERTVNGNMVTTTLVQ